MDVFNAPITTETCKVGAYVDDVKPGITSLAEFDLVDRGSAIFVAGLGCILHHDPSKVKVKFLPIGGWRPSGKHPGLQKADIPVPYKKVIGPWKSGKFMHLSQRSTSINTCCLKKSLLQMLRH